MGPLTVAAGSTELQESCERKCPFHRKLGRLRGALNLRSESGRCKPISVLAHLTQ